MLIQITLFVCLFFSTSLNSNDDVVKVSTSHLQVEQNGSDPHGLADLQAVSEEGEAWWALVVGW